MQEKQKQDGCGAQYSIILWNMKRTFDPKSDLLFPISRSKIEDFIRCARCFYLDVRLGIGRPSSPAFTLNIAVDALLKKEFDLHRAESSRHPFMEEYGIAAVPYRHAKLDEWRNNFKGIRHIHAPTNFEVFGAVDDIWIDEAKNLIVVDYKATSTMGAVGIEGGGYKDGYKREVEVYRWLLEQNGFPVSPVSYFVYANGKKDLPAFHKKLEFNITLIPYRGDVQWIPKALQGIKDALTRDSLPESGEGCEHCGYRAASRRVEKEEKQMLFK